MLVEVKEQQMAVLIAVLIEVLQVKQVLVSVQPLVLKELAFLVLAQKQLVLVLVMVFLLELFHL